MQPVLKARPVVVVVCLLSITGGKMGSEKPDFSKLTEEFVYGSLALSPVSATAAGYHEHQGIRLDEKLDDYSPGGIQDQRQFFSGFRERLALIKPETLGTEERADYQIIQNQVELVLLDLYRI